MSQPYLNVTTTVPRKLLGRRIAERLLEAHLAASVQVVGPIWSRYWWEDRIQEAKEYLCLIKTTGENYPRVEAIIRELHEYRVPEIYAVPLSEAPADYGAWIARYAGGGGDQEGSQ